MPATLQTRPDAQTIQRFEQIYLATYSRLSLFVHHFLRNKEAARDILQDTYTTLWQQLPSIKDDDKVYPLLRTYATNLMINLIRKTAREKKREEMFEASQEIFTSTEASFDLKEAMEQYRLALNQLPLKQKQVLQLSLEEGMTHREIAGKLNISSRTSKYLLMQARTFLRTQLQADKLAITILLVLSGK